MGAVHLTTAGSKMKPHKIVAMLLMDLGSILIFNNQDLFFKFIFLYFRLYKFSKFICIYLAFPSGVHLRLFCFVFLMCTNISAAGIHVDNIVLGVIVYLIHIIIT